MANNYSLDDLIGGESISDEVVDAISSKVDSGSLRLIENCRRNISQLEEKLMKAKTEYENLGKSIISKLKSAGKNNCVSPSGNTVYIKKETYYDAHSIDKVKAAKRAEMAFLLTVEKRNFAKVCKKLEESEGGLPDFVKKFTRETIVIRGL